MVSQITPAELLDRLDGDESFTLVDTRPEDSFEQWHLSEARNVPFNPREGFGEEHRRRVQELADRGPVVAICGKGLTSTAFGFPLEEAGYDDVTVVRGGMEELGTVHDVVNVDDGQGDVVVRQLQRRATGCLGYVVGSRATGEALVVDPTRRGDAFAVAAEAAGLTIEAVVDTHVHADHVSAGPALADQLDVPYFLGIDVEGGADHEYDSLADGETTGLGDWAVRALHVPGHTEDMAALVVDDEYVLTGDALFVDSVGRTELAFGEEDAERGAELLYESLHETVLELDDDHVVLPGHVSITEDLRFETGRPGEPIRARLGDLREDLDLLGLDREDFVQRLTEDLPEKPSEYERVIAVNAGEESIDGEAEASELDTGPNNCSA